MKIYPGQLFASFAIKCGMCKQENIENIEKAVARG